ncbi:hypothetical protein CRYUN_Cryun23aG0107200 [Craigia yunnanensis]
MIFQSVESSRTALSVGKITVKNFDLPLSPLHLSETVTIRISNINSETADSAIHSTCTLCGPLEGLTSPIVRLNSTVIDVSKWSAQLQNSESPSMTMIKNGNDDLGLKISGPLAELKREIYLKMICAEDLEYLHHSVLHLENHPFKGRRYRSNID